MNKNNKIIIPALIAACFLSGCDWNSWCSCSKKKEKSTETTKPSEKKEKPAISTTPEVKQQDHAAPITTIAEPAVHIPNVQEPPKIPAKPKALPAKKAAIKTEPKKSTASK